VLFDLHGLEAGPLSSLHIALALVAIGLLVPDLMQRRWRMLTLTMVAAVSAGLGRIAMSIIPSIQPVTPLIFIIGALTGSRRASACAIMATLISNFQLGMGVWSLYQALGWSMIGCFGATVSTYLEVDGRYSVWRIATICSLLAYPFGWVVSIPALEYGVVKYSGYVWNGLLFDTYHAIGNALFVLVIVPILNSSLNSSSIPFGSNDDTDSALPQ